ncbi:MAG TPA: 23S rRNA (adenine(2503)-C(2))-methyltransferase RlmN [Saprospiraceae bacterium]|nr:23S rRNA (adenine(2503)-C(2))-methyltransferase RlmN [Saprospiraceae bacterium]HPN68906.1 23S rRNA (adenine(2503)-C(2))-methyltransferase RlmN [Saprospiraceae bacterium]
MAEKLDIRKLSKEDIELVFASLGEPKFRAKQLYEWLWKKGATDFEQMSNLSKPLRAQLAESYEIRSITLDKVQKSEDGTMKSRFRLHDGFMIESVLIPVPEDDRYTVCISCQVGCSLTCSFCATGQMKRVRNLDTAEIYDQVVQVNNQCLEHFGKNITNIVYMGMGEPLLTYASMMESVAMITSPEGLGMSPKRITVSTAGIAKMIRKLADDGVKFNLALSLHAPDDVKRNEIMPINEQNNLEVLMDAIHYFHTTTGNRISYEYIAFDGFNEGIEDAKNLVKLCSRFPVKVNVIEYNTVEGVTLTKARQEQVDEFARYVRSKGVMISVRRSRGKDIDAACGQLANRE